MTYTITKPNRQIQGEITLDGSKSISNRVLIIQALCQEDFEIQNLSTSKDTTTLQDLLHQIKDGATLDTGAAGTTFRFLTAFLSSQSGTQLLTGSERMLQRPIGILVDALRQLGATIEYLGQEGYPPLKIHSPKDFGLVSKIQIAADTSSQYITALLLLAPTLPNGLELELLGKMVSRSYIEMTLNIMAYFGIDYQWEASTITIKPQVYQAKDFRVEADWSAASYHYALAAFAEKDVNIRLNGLYENSVQGDAVIAEIMEQFGIKTIFKEGFIYIKKSGEAITPMFEWDFIQCPDIAQTMAVICGGLGTRGLFTGLDTLKIKETDRIQALQNELAKTQVFLSKLPERFSKKSGKTYYMLEGKALLDNPTFATYKDHRMAMAFAPLALLGEIRIEDPMVVVKSYPMFWEDLEKLGFSIKK